MFYENGYGLFGSWAILAEKNRSAKVARGGQLTKRVSTRLTPSEGRQFGLTVGFAFLALAGLVYWRTGGPVVNALGTTGVFLVIAGIVVPTRLGPLFRSWMALALVISKITTPVLMALVYFLVITPIGLTMRVLGHNPLKQKEHSGGFWVDRKQEQDRRGSMYNQF